jgi:hypothetical protein
MPHLVSGHMKFTDKDFIHIDFCNKIKTSQSLSNKEKNNNEDECENIKKNMNFAVDRNNHNNHDNIKNTLSATLFSFAAIAHNLGYTIEELMSVNLEE